jgi:hypothetical protein
VASVGSSSIIFLFRRGGPGGKPDYKSYVPLPEPKFFGKRLALIAIRWTIGLVFCAQASPSVLLNPYN